MLILPGHKTDSLTQMEWIDSSRSKHNTAYPQLKNLRIENDLNGTVCKFKAEIVLIS